MAKRWTSDSTESHGQRIEEATTVRPVALMMRRGEGKKQARRLKGYFRSVEYGNFETGPEEGCYALETKFWRL